MSKHIRESDALMPGGIRMTPLSEFGRWMAVIGGVLLVTGGMLWGLGRLLSLGHLPGDIVIQKGSFTFFFPLASSLIVSIILTIIFNLIFRR